MQKSNDQVVELEICYMFAHNNFLIVGMLHILCSMNNVHSCALFTNCRSECVFVCLHQNSLTWNILKEKKACNSLNVRTLSSIDVGEKERQINGLLTCF